MEKFIIALYVATTASGLVLLKLGTNGASFVSLVDGRLNWNIGLLSVMGIFLYGVSFLLYIYLISRFNLGFIIPLTTGLVYILIFIASFVIFKESFTATKIAAIVLIVSGVILLNLNTPGTPEKSKEVTIESTPSKVLNIHK